MERNRSDAIAKTACSFMYLPRKLGSIQFQPVGEFAYSRSTAWCSPAEATAANADIGPAQSSLITHPIPTVGSGDTSMWGYPGHPLLCPSLGQWQVDIQLEYWF